MTDTESKALALVNEVADERGNTRYADGGSFRQNYIEIEALCRAIEQHEAFRQEVSDAVEAVLSVFDQLVLDDRGEAAMRGARLVFTRFIIPKPVDPLAKVLQKLDLSDDEKEARHDAEWVRKELDELGYEIREKAGD